MNTCKAVEHGQSAATGRVRKISAFAKRVSNQAEQKQMAAVVEQTKYGKSMPCQDGKAA